MTTDAYIAIGSNLGDRQSTIDRALIAINAHPAIEITALADIIETAPVGDIEQGPYLNTVLRARTTLQPRDLLTALLTIESIFGRDRTSEQRWGPRTLDLDLILYSDHIIHEPGLQIPHPRLHERTFVLIPLTQIAPDLLLPVHNKTPRQLLEALGGVDYSFS